MIMMMMMTMRRKTTTTTLEDDDDDDDDDAAYMVTAGRQYLTRPAAVGLRGAPRPRCCTDGALSPPAHRAGRGTGGGGRGPGGRCRPRGGGVFVENGDRYPSTTTMRTMSTKGGAM